MTIEQDDMRPVGLKDRKIGGQEDKGPGGQ